jgi:hypothetical protein
VASIFDRDDFNESLFYPRADTTEPGDAADRFVDVGGARVHVRVHPAADARCTVLLFHGNGEVVADYDDAAPVFAELGAALAVADFRGYGRSTGTPAFRALIADARPIAEAVGGPLVVMGRSLGGAAAHELYARPIAGMLGVVLESAFFDLAALVRRRGIAPPAPFPEADLDAFEPERKLRAGRLPLLVLHGDRDTLIVPDEAVAAHAAAGSADKQLVWVRGRGHNDIAGSPDYWAALAAFVTAVSRR